MWRGGYGACAIRYHRDVGVNLVARVLFVAGLAMPISACLVAVSTSGLSGGPGDDAAADATTDVAAEPSDASDASDAREGDAAEAGDARTLPPNAKTFPDNGHVYAVVHVPSGLTWHEARARAVEAGGHLATLGTAEENAFVITLADQAFADAFNTAGVGPWLGAYQPNPNGPNEPLGGWEWIDGTPFVFMDWRPTQPDNSSGAEHYLDLYRTGGVTGWNDDKLGGNGSPVISYVIEIE